MWINGYVTNEIPHKIFSYQLKIFGCFSAVFRETGTMGTLASQAEIGVWVQALQGVRKYYPRKKLKLCMQNPAI